MDLVLQALAERGVWHGSDDGEAELVRVEIRRAARKAGIKVCTIVDGLGRPRACTPDGWPAHEPWRGAAIHAHESGAMGAAVMQALARLLPQRRCGLKPRACEGLSFPSALPRTDAYDHGRIGLRWHRMDPVATKVTPRKPTAPPPNEGRSPKGRTAWSRGWV